MGAFPVKAPGAAPVASQDLAFWAQGLGGWGRERSDGNAAATSSKFAGFLTGVDARLSPWLRAGIAGGYTRSDLKVDARASSAGIDTAEIGAYAGASFGALNVRTGGSFAFDTINTSRTILFPGFLDQAQGRFDGQLGQVFGEVGYGLAWGPVALEPIAGLAYVHLHNGAFTETGGAAALAASGSDENIGYSTLGLRTATLVPLANGTVLAPRLLAEWQHAFGDVTPTAALAFPAMGTGFTVAGVPVARDAALVEAGVDWRFTPAMKVGVAYQGELASSAQIHTVKGAFTWNF
jgi:outer membrane autotransporter protein